MLDRIFKANFKAIRLFELQNTENGQSSLDLIRSLALDQKEVVSRLCAEFLRTYFEKGEDFNMEVRKPGFRF